MPSVKKAPSTCKAHAFQIACSGVRFLHTHRRHDTVYYYTRFYMWGQVQSRPSSRGAVLLGAQAWGTAVGAAAAVPLWYRKLRKMWVVLASEWSEEERRLGRAFSQPLRMGPPGHSESRVDLKNYTWVGEAIKKGCFTRGVEAAACSHRRRPSHHKKEEQPLSAGLFFSD